MWYDEPKAKKTQGVICCSGTRQKVSRWGWGGVGAGEHCLSGETDDQCLRVLDVTQGQIAGSSQSQSHSVSSHIPGLSINKCDFNITTNNNNHHTEEISTERLMVRRGQPFTITVSFSAPVHSYLQQLKRTFLIAQTGSIGTIPMRALLLHPPERRSSWHEPSPEVEESARI